MITLSAAGDGVTDDTSALQAVLDAGGHIYVPAGTYRVAGTPLRIRERTRLELAPDATILRASSPGLIRNRHPDDTFGGYSGRGQILIEGGAWDMAGATAGDTGLPASAMTFAHGDNIKVRDTIIRDVPGAHGIDCIGNRNVRITNVTFEGYKADPTDGQPRESIQIDGAYGAYSGDALPADKTPCEDVIVSGCTFRASDTLPAPQRAVGSHGYDADVTTRHHGIKVVDNTMAGMQDNAIHAWRWSESIIHRNHIYSPGRHGIVADSGSWDLDVVLNHIYDAGRAGIWLTDGANNVTVSLNRVVGASASANGAYDGIQVDDGCVTCFFTDNRVRMRSGVNNARYGLGIAGGGQQRMVHHGNYLIWSGVSGSRQDLSTSPTTSATDAL